MCIGESGRDDRVPIYQACIPCGQGYSASCIELRSALNESSLGNFYNQSLYMYIALFNVGTYMYM